MPTWALLALSRRLGRGSIAIVTTLKMRPRPRWRSVTVGAHISWYPAPATVLKARSRLCEPGIRIDIIAMLE